MTLQSSPRNLILMLHTRVARKHARAPPAAFRLDNLHAGARARKFFLHNALRNAITCVFEACNTTHTLKLRTASVAEKYQCARATNKHKRAYFRNLIARARARGAPKAF